MLKGLSWRSAVVVAVCLFAVLSLLPNFLPQSVRDSLPGFLPSRAITLGLDLQGGSYLLLEVDVAPVFKERLESMVGDVRAGLRAARINYRGLGVQGDTVSLALVDPAQRDQALAEIEKLNPLSLSSGGRVRDFDISDEAGRIVMHLTDAKKRRAAPGGDQPVARGGPPPHRRAGHARGLDPAPGLGPHPGPGAGREGSREHQAPARPHRAPDVPPGRPERQRPGRGGGAGAAGLDAARIGRARRRLPALRRSSARSSSAARTSPTPSPRSRTTSRW